MSDASDDPFAEGLAYEERLAMAWYPRDQAPDADERASLTEANEHTLRVLNGLEGYHPELHEGSGNEEILHLDFKLNVVLDLVSRLVAKEFPLPAPAPVRLSAHGVAWQPEVEAPPVGRWGIIELYLSSSYPGALRLPARVVATPAGQDPYGAVARFEGLGETVEEGLERLVFRHHRRQVARARHPRPDG